MPMIAKIVGSLVGRLNYTPAPWMTAINRFRQRRPAGFWLIIILLVAAVAGAGYTLTRPSPPQVVAKVTPPDPPADVDDPRPAPLVIRFDDDRQDPHPDRQIPQAPPSVARIDLIGKPVTGIQLEPALAGRWQWNDDHTLTFEPEQAWPAGTPFRIVLPPAIFSPETRLKKKTAEFTTPAFTAAIESIEFYQDPAQSSVRKVIATLYFSHPVNPAGLEQHLSMAMRPSGEGIDTPPQPVSLSVTYDKRQRRAYVASAPLDLPAQANTLRLTIAAGVVPAAGGKATTQALSDTVVVPDRYSFLKVEAAKASIVTNDRQEPQQVISLDFTDAIDRQTLLAKLSVYLLPAVNPRRDNGRWNGPRDVTPQDLAASQRLALKTVPNPRDAATRYHFVIDAPEKRHLYLRIDPNLASVNGFVQASFFDAVLAVPAYPRQVRLAGEGSLLTASGEQRLGIMARGLTALRATLGRLLPGQIAHLITQTDGDIRDPYFTNPEFSENNISAISREIIALKPLPPGKANYTALDLSTATQDEEKGYGLFFVAVEGWDPAHNRPVAGASDRRLILITDLGLLVKDNADDTHDIFVQQLSDGQPVADAAVQLLGKNGLPLFRLTTDAEGHAVIPVTRDFTDERQPSVYLVTTATDTAFIPFESHSRQVDFSRFDVGGQWDDVGPEGQLNAFLFSDRGIYRPGETVQLGMIVKKTPLDNVADIPLEVAIQGPRNNPVKTERVVLPAKGFFEFTYPTEATAATGRYTVSLYLVRDNQHRGRLLGSTDFTVEEFLPDTMKIKSTLTGAEPRGWSPAPTLSARVSLTNLFGAPAQSRRLQARISIRSADFRFSQWRDYHFSDPLGNVADTPLTLDEALPPASTNDLGQAVFDIPLDRFREGTYRLDFFVEGFDPAGGRSVSAHNGTLISPLPHLVGFKSDGDLGFIHAGGERQVDWIAIDPDLKPLALENLTLTRLEIQHLSTLVKQPNGTFAYQTVDRERQVDSQPFAIAAEGSTLSLATADPGDYAIEVRGSDGTRLARLTYSVVGHGNLTGRLEKEAALQLRLDKSDYKAGEIIQVSITAPYVGAGLMTIESNKVHAFKWFKTTTTSTLETIRLPSDLEGNAYLNVAFVRDAASKEIFTSPLSTAVAPITIDRSRRQLTVDLRVDEKVKPGETLTIGYRTDRPSRVVIFAVDEGILQVAGYQMPQPLDHFMKKRALRVDTRQMLDLILPPYALLHEAMASGGDAMKRALAANINPFARQTDTPAVFWSGIVDGDKKERTVNFTVPDTFAGNLVVMAVAVGESAVGTATANTLVRGPFVLSPSLLLQAAPGDEFSVTVGVSNLVEGSGPDATITVGMIASRNLIIVGERTRQVAIGEGDEAPVHFIVHAGNAPGAASLTFTAQLGDAVGSRTAGLSIRPAMPYHTTFTSGYAKDGSARLPITRNLFDQLAEQHAAASASPLVLVDALTAYLEHFPHGCTEQLVSQVFPLVALSTVPAYAAQRPAIEKQVGVLIDRLRERQQANGGFSFWPGSDTAVDFPSVYALHFLIEAREAGFAVPADMLRRGMAFIREVADRKIADLADAVVRAQAIYLLTRQGETTTNLLVRLQENLEKNHKETWRSDLTAVYMAATYRLLKMDGDAQRLASRYRLGTARNAAMGDFDQPLTRDAQALYLLSRHFEGRARDLDGAMILQLLDPIFKGETNTIGASYTILGLVAYGRLNLPEGQPDSVHFQYEAVDGTKRPLDSRNTPFPTASYLAHDGQIGISGATPLFYANVQSGFDRTLPDVPLRSGLEIYRDYLDADGAMVGSFVQGQEVLVRLRIRALEAEYVNNVAVIDLLPGGFEAVRQSVSRQIQGWRADYVDVREDRVIFYGSVDKSVRELTYRAKVTAPGQFTRPPAFAESMYDRSLKAATPAGVLTVMPAP